MWRRRSRTASIAGATSAPLTAGPNFSLTSRRLADGPPPLFPVDPLGRFLGLLPWREKDDDCDAGVGHEVQPEGEPSAHRAPDAGCAALRYLQLPAAGFAVRTGAGRLAGHRADEVRWARELHRALRQPVLSRP